MVTNGDEWNYLLVKHGCDITKLNGGDGKIVLKKIFSIAMFDYCTVFVPVNFSTSSMRCLRGLQTRPRHLAKSWSWGRLSQRFLCWIISSALTSTLLAASWHEIHPGTGTLSLFCSDSQGKEWTEKVKLYCK